jgi:hypothetical protein
MILKWSSFSFQNRWMTLVSLESSQQGGVHGLNSMKFGLLVQFIKNIE